MCGLIITASLTNLLNILLVCAGKYQKEQHFTSKDMTGAVILTGIEPFSERNTACIYHKEGLPCRQAP